MTLLSFSGTTSQGPFWQQILQGRKTQTCRVPRKVPIKPGDRLHLYWLVRIPAFRKPIHRIGEAVCTSVQKVQYEDFAWDDEFAKRDGFRDHRELQGWFGSTLVFGHEVYDVISWGALQSGIADSGPVITFTDAQVLDVVQRHRGSTVAVRTIVNTLLPCKGRFHAKERGIVADSVSRVLERELGPPLTEIRGRRSEKYTNMSKVFSRVEWLVRSKKTGVVCHHSSTRAGAQRWSDKFLQEYGEVVPE